MFQFSRPKERDSRIKHAILNADVFKAPCHQLSEGESKRLSLELCAKWLISEMAVANRNRQQRIASVHRPSIPMVYPDASPEPSMDYDIPPLPVREQGKSITAPPPPPSYERNA